MTSRLAETEAALVNLMRDNLTDPIKAAGRTGQWVYSGIPHPKAKTPRIHVLRRGESTPYPSLGTYRQDQILGYQITVMVGQGVKGVVDGTVYGGTELLNQLCDEVVELLETHAGSVSGVHRIQRIDSGGYFYDQAYDNYVCPMSFEVTVLNRT